MTRIILVRHGETEWNVGEVFRGRRDVALNETGFRQAVLVGEYLADMPIEAAYSSPLKRALDTAECVAFALDHAARELACRVLLLAILDRERQEGQVLRIMLGNRRHQNHAVAILYEDGAVSLSHHAARLNAQSPTS